MRWTLKTAPNLSLVDELSEVLSIDKVLSSLLIQRGIHTFDQAKKFFRPSLDDLHDPFIVGNCLFDSRNSYIHIF